MTTSEYFLQAKLKQQIIQLFIMNFRIYTQRRELKNDDQHIYLYHLEEEHSIWIAYGYYTYI